VDTYKPNRQDIKDFEMVGFIDKIASS